MIPAGCCIAVDKGLERRLSKMPALLRPPLRVFLCGLSLFFPKAKRIPWSSASGRGAAGDVDVDRNHAIHAASVA